MWVILNFSATRTAVALGSAGLDTSLHGGEGGGSKCRKSWWEPVCGEKLEKNSLKFKQKQKENKVRRDQMGPSDYCQ